MDIKLHIKEHYDRMELLRILQDAGYDTRIETHTEYTPTRVYICFDYDEFTKPLNI